MKNMENTNFTFRMDKQLKKEAEELFDELGITLSSALTLFLKQSVREQRIPFEISLQKPNKKTIQAIKEGEKVAYSKKVKGFTSVDEFMVDLNGKVRNKKD